LNESVDPDTVDFYTGGLDIGFRAPNADAVKPPLRR
jgi:hypothetical protein